MHNISINSPNSHIKKILINHSYMTDLLLTHVGLYAGFVWSKPNCPQSLAPKVKTLPVSIKQRNN